MTKQRKILWRAVSLVLVLGVILKDQLSKWWVVHHLFKGHDAQLLPWLVHKAERFPADAMPLTDNFNLALVWNPGVSFGMLQSHETQMAYALSAMAIFVVIGFLIWMWRDPKPAHAVCVGLIVGGALGNVMDRLRFGAVIDFVDLHVGVHHWPAFNVADSAISIGVIALLIYSFFFSHASESSYDEK